MVRSPLLTAFLVFCAVAFGTLSFVLLWEVARGWFRRRQVNRRLRPVLEEQEEPLRGTAGDLIREVSEEGGLLTALADAMPGWSSTRALLREADLDWTAQTFILLSLGLAVGAGSAAYILTGLGLVALPVSMLGAAAPYLYAAKKRRDRYLHFEEQFPEAIDLLTRAIRAGHPLSSGMRMVAEEGPAVVAKEFRQTFEEQRFGLAFDDALLGMVDRVGLVDVRIFAIAVLVQREVGGNLAEILDNLAETIRGRFYIRRQLRVYTAQGRLSGYALGALPIAVGLAMWLLNPEHIGLLFTSLTGWMMVGTALFLQAVGVLWIRKIINIDI